MPTDSTPPHVNLRPGASMREVAERAGVALSSVSRVLSGHPDVSAVMRNRVLDAAAALGYEPNLLAKGLRSGATRTVGFVVGDISNPLLAQIVLGAETALRKAGYAMLLTADNDPGMDSSHITLLRQRQVDGLLLSLADDTAEPTAAALRNAGVPYVLIDREVAGTGSAVLSAHDNGMAAAVTHLVGLGHERIALINGPSQVRPSRERAKALRRECRATGAIALVRSGPFTADYGAGATRSLLALPEPPTAIIAGSNQILAGVLDVLRRDGIRVPADVSLVSCDDVPLTRFVDPPLAMITRDPPEMGRVAAELLLDLLGGGQGRDEVLPTDFRAAGSCAPPPAAATERAADQER
ncbi:LacI family DNA-binding transcriptional regulator [Spongiactinospora sp. 9N601]|uniref:LacI family DNA-binding transcriptional regulator n=1 Tax=Spongiactinospora sp. 9N601 TaxID=3375149 RepID=UPI0037B578C4